ncbi:triose-phosphate isomerase [Microbacterium sp. SSM24]|uniref:triose-phosphate isomerase n=1 Tax=Microbacterium sp. SSM24 TaxID=2991714 RepID=UPI002226B4BA|nr:triose-phosphate isomerase family protein [Microbacterium sp. SSM24]MCW3492636.1 triose-phosphate isomerase [Microbacterium sp. SSM24]
MTPVQVGINLKLYFDLQRTREYASAIATIALQREAVTNGTVEVWLAPAVPYLAPVAEALRGSPVILAAQNVDRIEGPAFTGGVGVKDLIQLGTRKVIVGHADRRRRAGEDDAVVAEKVRMLRDEGMRPVICIGEPEARGVADALDHCARQLAAIGSVGSESTIAYEPVWAIGAEAPPSVAYLRAVLGGIKSRFPESALIYGGSAGPGLLELLGADADGIFLGRFGHDPTAVGRVIDEAERRAVARSQEVGEIRQEPTAPTRDRGIDTEKGSR